VDEYGASFQAWNTEEFAKAWNAVRRALPYNQLACVVPFILFLLSVSFLCPKKYYGIFNVENNPKNCPFWDCFLH
jgi:hypothetical protein